MEAARSPRWHGWAWSAWGAVYFFTCSLVATEVNWLLGLAVWVVLTAGSVWVMKSIAARKVARIRAARFVAPEVIPGYYLDADGIRVDTQARLMGTTHDGYLRYVLTVADGAIGCGMDVLPGRSVMEVVTHE